MTSQWMQCGMYAYQAVPMQHNKQFSGGRGLNNLLWYTIDTEWRGAAVYGDFGRVLRGPFKLFRDVCAMKKNVVQRR